MIAPAVTDYRRAATTNRTQIDGWLWRARYHVRKGRARLACEAMLTALWLMGIERA